MPHRSLEAGRVASKNHYDNNKEYYAERNKRMRDELRGIVRAAKDVPCTDCGVKYPYYVMQFDHIADDKEYNIASLVNSGSKKKLLAEITKCEVVCANCHAVRTYARANRVKTLAV